MSVDPTEQAGNQAITEAARLRRRIERLEGRIAIHERTIVRQQSARLRALSVYGGHLPSCNSYLAPHEGGENVCSCGYAEELANAGRPVQKGWE